MLQLLLFKSTIESTYLVADSPKKAFYRLSMETDGEIFYIKKQSGAGTKILDKRFWSFATQDEANKRYKKIVEQKTNPKRKHKRIYKEVDDPN